MKRLRDSKPVFADPENFWRLQGIPLIAGVDEVGRGPLAGPVVAVAVILAPGVSFPGLKDSKCLTPQMRADLDTQIRAQALAYALGEVEVRQIERLGVGAACLKAMALAVRNLSLAPDLLLVDGAHPLPLPYPQQPVIDGDAICPSISAASVVAKVYRDRRMEAYHQLYPQYNFARHKGYGTREHLAALSTWGPCTLHRRTFKGVKEWLEDRG